MPVELSWGRRYVMVEPTHFRVDYAINPFMDVDDQPDPALATAQWRGLVATIEALGATVDVVPARPDALDMVYAMNLGLGVVDDIGQQQVVMSHMRYPQRRMETSSAQPWFAGQGFATSYVGRDGVGAHLEAGDACGACGSATRGCTTSTSRSAPSMPVARWCAQPHSTAPARGRCSTWSLRRSC